jgi:trigger factor
MTTTLTNLSIKELPESTIEVSATIPWEVFQSYEAEALKTLGANIELPGFRKGNVPADLLRKELGDELVLTEMAERAITHAYADILKEKEIVALGRPSVTINKIARDNELGFTLTTAIMPTVALPDYKAIAKGIPTIEPVAVTDEDVTKVIEELRELKAYGHVHAPGTEHQHTETLPEVDDEFAKSFGNFNSVEELRAKVKENLVREKERDALDKRRLAIIDAISSQTEIAVPEALIKAEAEKMLAQIEMDVARAGHTLDAYLTETGKTREQLIEEYKPEAGKRAKMQLVISSIAKDAHITVADDELKTQVEHLIKTYPGADKERTEAYATMVLTNERVLDMLEAIK